MAEPVIEPVRQSPCSWPISYADCDGGICEPLASMPASGQDNFEAMAVEYLWRWTARRLGVCTVEISPCRDDCTDGVSTYYGGMPASPGLRGSGAPWRPVIVGGQWMNISCGMCGESCTCSHVSMLEIPGPVQGIDEITIDGEVLADSRYHVVNGRTLLRDDGEAWPRCAERWTITYQRGLPVPLGGQIAAGVLACELAKAACGQDDCQLPRRVQTVSRQGVTVAMMDSFDDIDTGHTGIWLIDSWVASMMKPKLPSRVYSPDIGTRSRRQTRSTYLGG